MDLQKLGLDKIELKGRTLNLGAAVTLQALLDEKDIQPALRQAIRLEG